MTTLNKNLTTPANNSSNWDVPLNSNFNILDIAFGGVQAFNLAAFAGGTIAVSSGTYVGSYPTNTASYLPLTFSITGTPTGNTTLQIPSTVGGSWIVRNAIPSATSFTLTISSAGGGTSVVVPNGTTRTVFSDGTNIAFTDNQTAIVGSNNQVIYNASGVLTGSSGLTFDGTTVTGTAVADASGLVRNVPVNTQTSGYTLVASDNGKYVNITTGGVIVPSGVFANGQNVTIYNNSTSSQTITQGSGAVMTLVGTTLTGNRTLAGNGLCTVLCVATPGTFIITGAGIS